MKTKQESILILASILLLLLSEKAEAFWVHLNDAQRGEAMYYGARNVKTDAKEFFKEWTFDKGIKGVVILNSEFLTLASAAREAAISGDEMDADAIEDALAKTQGKLVFTVYLYGKEKDFAKDYSAVIKTGGKTYPASYWEEGESSPSETHPGMIAEELFFYFPLGEISPDSPVTLEIGDSKLKEKFQFDIDLKKVK
jgi:hypothetical protein